jgi:glycosyltransferase involved in cell wall biosynthesis
MIDVLEVGKSTGGVGEYLRWLANGLDKQEFRLTFVCLSENGAELAAELSATPGVRALSMPMNRYQIAPLSDARAGWRLMELMRGERFQVVHAHASKAGFLARLAGAVNRLPVLYSPHAFAFQKSGLPALSARLYAAVESFMARWFTAKIVTVSKNEREAARLYGIGDDALFVTVPSGVELEAPRSAVDRPALRRSLGVPAGAPLVGVAARLISPKTPVDFVEAAARVRAQVPGSHFVWVGDGPLAAETRTAIDRLGLGDCVHMAGYRSDVPDILRVMDCYVLPSRSEAMPISVLEAMAANVPVVATRNPGTQELIVDGIDGVLVPCGAPEALAGAIQSLLQDSGLSKRLVTAARNKIEKNYTRAGMLTRLAELYRRTARSGRSGN